MNPTASPARVMKAFAQRPGAGARRRSRGRTNLEAALPAWI
jgi:hypothetical protein